MLKISLLTSIALIALAANSVLCRLALGAEAMDPVSFTLVRLLSGVLALMALLWGINLKNKQKGVPAGSYKSAGMLFLYAIAFSIAYLDLDTGIGALILFGSVQLTMITVGIFTGQRLHTVEWCGLALAFSGFVYLVLPGLSTPSVFGFVLMTLAGVAWGGYTLMGRGSQNPLADTAYNFFRTWPFLLVLVVWLFWQGAEVSSKGLFYAVVSGAITSGVGYAIWYAVLKYYTSTQAGVLQLSVPLIAALGGVVFVGEQITLALTISSIMILGGIFLVIGGRHYLLK